MSLEGRDPNAYRVYWSELLLRRIVVLLAVPNVLGFGIGVPFVVLAAWYAGGFRCPRCKQRFAGKRLSFLLLRSCKSCGLRAGSQRNLDEPPLFPRLDPRA